MNLYALARVGKALFLFIREMWLRDRTFRQFVHENLTLLVSSTGFLIMTVLFSHVYFIAAEQTRVIKNHEERYARLKEDYDDEIPVLNDRLNWYRDRYLELKAPAAKPINETVPTPKKPQEPVIPKRPNPIPSDDEIFDRWNKLAE